MSETQQQTALEPEGAVAPPEGQEAPAAEAPAEEQPTEREKEQESKFNKRIGYLQARASRAERDRDETLARLAAIERQLQSSGMAQQVDPQAALNAEVQRRVEEQRAKEVGERFWAAGAAAYPDWADRCKDLQAMGAVPISQAMAEMPDGHRIAAALRDAPEELEEILSHPGERARAVALGKFAARMAASPARNVSRAPAPPKPISGRASPVFNEQAATTDQLVDFYAKQAMERRRG